MPPVSLKNVKVSTIKPYTKTEHPAVVGPSIFDLHLIDSFSPVVFFYKPDGQQADAFINLVKELKESLSKVLVPYFPMAGRWVRTYDSSRIRELECNDEGATFIEASVDEKLESVVKLNDFEAVEILAGHHFLGLDPKAFNQDVETPLPCLFVQVTQFKCGSVALHVTFCHMTTDGHGFSSFLFAWSEIALHGRTSMVPIHDRSLTASVAEFTRSAAGNAGGGDVVKPENVSTEKLDTNPRRVDPGVVFKFPTEVASNKTLHVSRKVIGDLKREAALHNMNVTTMDLITAHFWRSLSRLPESLDGKTSSVILSAVEGRSRYHDPPLPERYFGNVFVMCSTPQLTVSDLAAGNSPLIAANVFRNSLPKINASNWQSHVLHVMGEIRNFPNLKYRMLITTNWLRFPLYKISFGRAFGFGKPILASSNGTHGMMPSGSVIVQPPPPALADTVIASVFFSLTNGDAARTLFNDAEFRSLFLDIVQPSLIQSKI